MTGFQKFVMELIGLDPYFYRPIDTSYQANAYRDMDNHQMMLIDEEFNRHIKEETDVYGYVVWYPKKIRPHEFIIEMMNGYDLEKARVGK